MHKDKPQMLPVTDSVRLLFRFHLLLSNFVDAVMKDNIHHICDLH